MTTRLGDISDTYGSGGANAVPGGAQGTPAHRDVFRELLASIGASYATTAAMQASKAVNRADGQLVVRTLDHSVWMWDPTDATTADATHIQPTDVSSAGRFVQKIGGIGATLSMQSGTGTLVNGVSADQSATLTASSRIIVSSKTHIGTAIGRLEATAADRNVGASTFKVCAFKSDGTAETNDQSTFDWFVIG